MNQEFAYVGKINIRICYATYNVNGHLLIIAHENKFPYRFSYQI